jgi:hypothetical protein
MLCSYLVKPSSLMGQTFCSAFVLCNGQTQPNMLAKVPGEPNTTLNIMDRVKPFHDIKLWIMDSTNYLEKIFMFKRHILVTFMSVYNHI